MALAWRKLVWFWTKPSDWYFQLCPGDRFRTWNPGLGALAVVGAILTYNRRRSSLFLILFGLYYNAIIVVIYFACRYRLVVEPVWLLLAAGGIGELLGWLGLAS